MSPIHHEFPVMYQTHRHRRPFFSFVWYKEIKTKGVLVV